jgi:hypothetical protein
MRVQSTGHGEGNGEYIKFLTTAARSMTTLNPQLTAAASCAFVEAIWLSAHPRDKSGYVLVPKQRLDRRILVCQLSLAEQRVKLSMTYPMKNGCRPAAARLGHKMVLVSLCRRHRATAQGAGLIADRRVIPRLG